MDPIVIFELLAACGVLAVIAMFLARSAARAKHSEDEVVRDASSADAALAHAEVMVSWAEGSRQDWDRHVRPVLAREFENRFGTRRSGSGSLAATGVFLFGAELWPLVDPGRRFTGDDTRPGPGRKALAQILDRLEGA